MHVRIHSNKYPAQILINMAELSAWMRDIEHQQQALLVRLEQLPSEGLFRAHLWPFPCGRALCDQIGFLPICRIRGTL